MVQYERYDAVWHHQYIGIRISPLTNIGTFCQKHSRNAKEIPVLLASYHCRLPPLLENRTLFSVSCLLLLEVHLATSYPKLQTYRMKDTRMPCEQQPSNNMQETSTTGGYRQCIRPATSYSKLQTYWMKNIRSTWEQ